MKAKKKSVDERLEENRKSIDETHAVIRDALEELSFKQVDAVAEPHDLYVRGLKGATSKLITEYKKKKTRVRVQITAGPGCR